MKHKKCFTYQIKKPNKLFWRFNFKEKENSEEEQTLGIFFENHIEELKKNLSKNPNIQEISNKKTIRKLAEKVLKVKKIKLSSFGKEVK